MAFFKTEVDMAGFPFDRSPDDASNPETHHPAEFSNTPQSYDSSPLFDGRSANSYFPSSTSHETKWLSFDDASKDGYFPGTRSSPVDVPMYSQPLYDSSVPSSLGSFNSDSFALSNCHQVELSKITEYETWSMSQPANSQSSAKNLTWSYPTSSSSYHPPSPTYPSSSPKTEYALHQRSPLARANSGSGKPLSRPDNPQTPVHPKRRMSASGTPEASPSLLITDPALPVDEVKTPPKAKTSAKVSHSITERRYRENLNSKIVQLDQTLSLTRNANDQGQNSEGQDEQCVETQVKARKADVLNEAMRYVKQAEQDGKARTKEIQFLRLRVAALEKLVNCGDCALLKQFAGQPLTSPSDF